MADEADVGTKHMAPVAGVAPRSADELRKDLFAASGIFLFAFALYLLPAVHQRPLSETPEARVAEVAREMVRSGDYVVPRLAGEPRLTKPPLPYWLVAGAAQALGGGGDLPASVMTRATLLPPALLGALALFIVVLYGCLVFGRPAGIMAGLMLGLSIIFCHHAQLGYADTTLMFTCAAMFCCAAWLLTTPRPGILVALGLGVSLGLAVLSKGHIPLLLLALPLLVEVIIRHRFNGRKVLLFTLALVVAAAVAVPWFLAVEKRLPGAWQTMRAEMAAPLHASGHDQDDARSYYLYHLAGGLLPWTALLLAAWPIYLLKCRDRKAGDASGAALLGWEQARFFLLAFVLGFIAFYVSPKQQPHYLLPILPALALVCGYLLNQFKVPGGIPEESLAWSQLAIGLLGGLALASAPLWPLKALASSAGTAEGLALLAPPGGWAISVPAGVAFFALQFFCARQLVEGKPIAAAAALGIVAYLGLGVGSWFWADHVRRTEPLLLEAPRLQSKLQELGSDVKIYDIGISHALLVYYLDMPVGTEHDLAAEADAPQSPPRVFIVRRKELPLVQKAYGLTEQDHRVALNDDRGIGQEPYVILRLPREQARDWPKDARQALSTRPKKKDDGE